MAACTAYSPGSVLFLSRGWQVISSKEDRCVYARLLVSAAYYWDSDSERDQRVTDSNPKKRKIVFESKVVEKNEKHVLCTFECPTRKVFYSIFSVLSETDVKPGGPVFMNFMFTLKPIWLVVFRSVREIVFMRLMSSRHPKSQWYEYVHRCCDLNYLVKVLTSYINLIKCTVDVYGHTTLKIPVLVRSPKSSNVGRG